jgi:hypothetical protein
MFVMVLALTCLDLMDMWLSTHGPSGKLLLTHTHTHTHTHIQGGELLCEQVRGEDRAPEVWRGSACELSLLQIYYVFEAGRSIGARWRGRQCESCRASQIARQQESAHSQRET